MNPFEARGLKEAGGVANDHPSLAGERRQRPPSAVRKRLGAIADHFAAVEQLGNKRMLLEGLKHVLRVEARVAIVESGNESKRDDVVFRAASARAINPCAAVLFRGQRITHGVDDFARLDAARRHFPQFLYSYAISLRVAVFHQIKLLDELLCERSAGAFGEHDDLCSNVVAGLEI